MQSEYLKENGIAVVVAKVRFCCVSELHNRFLVCIRLGEIFHLTEIFR